MAARDSIRTLFARTFGVMAAAPILLILVSEWQIYRLRGFVEGDLDRQWLVPRLSEGIRTMQDLEDLYITVGTEDELHKFQAQEDRCLADLEALMVTATDDEDETQKLKVLRASMVSYRKHLEAAGEVIADRKHNKDPEQYQRDLAKKQEALESINSLAPQIVSKEIARTGRYRSSVQARFVAMHSTQLAMVVALLVGLVYSVRNGNRLVKRIVELIGKIQAMADSGRMDQDLPVRGEKELRDLASAFNQMAASQRESSARLVGMVQKVGEAVARIGEVTREVTEGASAQHRGAGVATQMVEQVTTRIASSGAAVRDAAQSADEGSRAAEGIFEAGRRMAEQATGAAKDVEETSRSVEELTISVKGVAEGAAAMSDAAETTTRTMARVSTAIEDVRKSASATAQLSEEVATRAAAGVEAVRHNIEGIGRIDEETRLVTRVVGTLAERVDRIGEVIAVIEDVADRTGLLALNASIIAASAGEAGRGFAVVAEEVKQLAGKTRMSTGEIADVVRSIEQSTREVTEASSRSTESVKLGVSLARAAEGTLAAILDSARTSQSRASEIARATDEQTRSVAEINEAVRGVADSAQASAEATRRQAGEAGQIRKTVGQLREVVRAVERQSREQQEKAQGVVTAIEGIRRRMEQLAQTQGEQATSSTRVLSAVQQIAEVTQRNRTLVRTLEEAVAELQRGAGVVAKEIGRAIDGASDGGSDGGTTDRIADSSGDGDLDTPTSERAARPRSART